MKILGIALVIGAAGCVQAPSTVFERLSEARRLAAETLVQFTKSSDATNRAVMAGTDDAAAQFMHEADEAGAAVQTSIDQLKPLLTTLGYANESKLMDEFASRFAEYHKLDSNIREMVADSSNLKAQRLSFGQAWQEADAVRDRLQSIAPLVAAKDRSRVEARGASALASVREIQALQAPHIAEPTDESMTRFEQRMAESEAKARQAFRDLAGSVSPAAKPGVTAAAAALDRFMSVNAEILKLSRRNSNVHALALSLGQKRVLVATCEDSLRVLQGALAKRGTTGTR